VKGLPSETGDSCLKSRELFYFQHSLKELLLRLDPSPPAEVLREAKKLAYRDFILVGLIVNRPNLFPDQWVYIHSRS